MKNKVAHSLLGPGTANGVDDSDSLPHPTCVISIIECVGVCVCVSSAQWSNRQLANVANDDLVKQSDLLLLILLLGQLSPPPAPLSLSSSLSSSLKPAGFPSESQIQLIECQFFMFFLSLVRKNPLPPLLFFFEKKKAPLPDSLIDGVKSCRPETLA